MKSHDHTDSELSVHRKIYADDEHRRAANGTDQRRKKTEYLIEFSESDFLRVDACLIPRPFFEISVLRAACFYRFYHFDTRNGRSRKFTRITHLNAGYVYSLFGNYAGKKEIYYYTQKPDKSQNKAVTEHYDKIKNHHNGV